MWYNPSMLKNTEDYNKYMREYMQKRHARRRQEGMDLLGGICIDCGSSEHLIFHHKDPTEKSFTLAKYGSCSEERWLKELNKCVLLCESCHKDEHKSKAVCGTPQRYWRGCRCKPCTTANTIYCSKS